MIFLFFQILFVPLLGFSLLVRFHNISISNTHQDHKRFLSILYYYMALISYFVRIIDHDACSIISYDRYPNLC